MKRNNNNNNNNNNNIDILTFKSPRITLCAISFNVQKFCNLPTVHLCVLRGSQNKKRLFLFTALTYRFL
jgi:hypothetical protein